MDRGAWWATAHGVTRVRHDLATKPSPPPATDRYIDTDIFYWFCLLVLGWKIQGQGADNFSFCLLGLWVAAFTLCPQTVFPQTSAWAEREREREQA